MQLGVSKKWGVPFGQSFQKSPFLDHGSSGYLWCTSALGNPRFFSSMELDQRLPEFNSGMLWLAPTTATCAL